MYVLIDSVLLADVAVIGCRSLQFLGRVDIVESLTFWQFEDAYRSVFDLKRAESQQGDVEVAAESGNGLVFEVTELILTHGGS
jgi:hypothetical protein